MSLNTTVNSNKLYYVQQCHQPNTIILLVNPDVTNGKEVASLEKLIMYQKRTLEGSIIPAKYRPRQMLKICHPAQKQIEEAFLKDYESIF